MRLSRILLLASTLVASTLALPEDALPEDALPEDPDMQFEKRQDTKYFHEPGWGDDLGHYDIRYFKGQPVSYEQKQETLQHLIRSYLTFFRDRNIETWIAHGTLLGWWWNGRIMPWDWDLDTQVSGSTLLWLGENLNMTFHNYTEVREDGVEIHREYLLDVNPNHVERVRGDGQNVIDARWIDLQNGLFIDITGLSETNPGSQPGVWSCKNYHRYRTRELYPMRETIFEGVPALVPYSFDRILTQEYSSRALTKTVHEGHRWVPEQKEWVKLPELSATQKREFGNGAKPHIPRSVQADSNPEPGLGNILRVL